MYKVILFYKYQDLENAARADEAAAIQRELCARLGLMGRVYIAVEGVNATVSGSKESIDAYIAEMEVMMNGAFAGISYKHSDSVESPFPDFHCKRVKELVASSLPVNMLTSKGGGVHLSPEEFHSVIKKHGKNDDFYMIDVRNKYEFDVGHFEGAANPNTRFFSEWTTWADKNLDKFQNKKVLMYCTGGIRCEKASAFLKQRGVEDVSQLSGGIHKYMERYTDGGFFKGANYVFDRRFLMRPKAADKAKVVGKCIECAAPHERFDGLTVCTVCRDLLLVCGSCRKNMREFHCGDHEKLKKCYFWFLEPYSEEELEGQVRMLREYIAQNEAMEGGGSKGRRRTARKQIVRCEARIAALRDGSATADPEAPKRCRTCTKQISDCPGTCWGFWRSDGTEVRPKLSKDQLKKKQKTR